MRGRFLSGAAWSLLPSRGSKRFGTRSPPPGFSGQDHFPEEMERRRFYDPPERGFEREVRKRLEYWERLRRRPEPR